jgi:hypothetical protein
MKRIIVLLLLSSCESQPPDEVRGGCIRTESGTIEYAECIGYQDGECLVKVDGEVVLLRQGSTKNSPEFCAFGNELLKQGVDTTELKEILGL